MQLTTINYETNDICILMFSWSTVQRRCGYKKNSSWIVSVNKENVFTFWICLLVLPHSDISVFHTFFFLFLFLVGGWGCRYFEILFANLHWRAVKLITTKIGICEVRCTFNLSSIFFFSIDSSEARKNICWILSVKHANNKVCTWLSPFSRLQAASSFWLKRMCSPF